MRIREVLSSEEDAVRRLVTEAFLTAEHADGTEGELVGRLRASPEGLTGYEVAAEDRGELIGHAMMTRGSVPTKEGTLPVLVLAPVSVALSHRRKGVGAQLVETLLAKGRHDGWAGAVVLGDPAYYGRFGFVEASTFGWTRRPNTRSRKSGATIRPARSAPFASPTFSEPEPRRKTTNAVSRKEKRRFSSHKTKPPAAESRAGG